MSKKATKATETRIAERLLKGEPIGEGGIIFNGLEIREAETGAKQTKPRKTKEDAALEAELARSGAEAAGAGSAGVDSTVGDTTGTTGTTATTSTGNAPASGTTSTATPSTGNAPASGTGTSGGGRNAQS